MCLFILRWSITNIIVIVAARINVKISGQSLRKTGYFHSLRYLPLKIVIDYKEKKKQNSNTEESQQLSP